MFCYICVFRFLCLNILPWLNRSRSVFAFAASTMKYLSLSKQPISILNRISFSKWKWWKSIFYTLSSSTVLDSLLKIDKFLLSSIRKYVFLIYFTITTPAPALARTALEISSKWFAAHFFFRFLLWHCRILPQQIKFQSD